jgi:hypothetical protein
VKNTLSATHMTLAVLALTSSCHLFSAEPKAIDKAPASQFPTLIPTVSPDSQRPTFTTDPARDQALRIILSLLPELRQKSSPYIRIAIPDSLELQRMLALPTAQADNDPPVVEALPADRPKLPTPAPAAAKQ